MRPLNPSQHGQRISSSFVLCIFLLSFVFFGRFSVWSCMNNFYTAPTFSCCGLKYYCVSYTSVSLQWKCRYTKKWALSLSICVFNGERDWAFNRCCDSFKSLLVAWQPHFLPPCKHNLSFSHFWLFRVSSVRKNGIIGPVIATNITFFVQCGWFIWKMQL